MYSLREHIINYFGKESREAALPFHWAVVFPETGRFHIGTSAQQWQVCFREEFQRDFKGFLHKCIKNSLITLESYNLYRKTDLPELNTVNNIINFLRPDFEQYPSLARHLEETEGELLQLTHEQYRALDELQDNARCLFRGGAGVGKTFIALEAFRRAVNAGRSVLLLTYSSLVSTWIRYLLRNDIIPDDSAVKSIMELLHCEQGLDPVKDRELIAEYLLEMANQGIVSPYDELIIDEGQDIIQESFLFGIDALVKGGLQKGTWKIFGDFEKQAVYWDLPEDQINELAKIAPNFLKFTLLQNCRNTGNIFDYLIPLSGFSPESSPMRRNQYMGDEVDYFFYKNRQELISFLQKEIKALKERGASLYNITVLSPVPFKESVASDLLPYKVYDVAANPDWFIKKDGLSYADIRSFKGLENNIIFLTEIENLSEMSRKLLYTAISRAKQKLFLCLPWQMAPDFIGVYLPSIQNKNLI